MPRVREEFVLRLPEVFFVRRASDGCPVGQFSLHVLLVFATGLTIGSERAVVPVLGRDVLAVESLFVIGSFVVSFGFVKALLILGWATALPLPLILPRHWGAPIAHKSPVAVPP